MAVFLPDKNKEIIVFEKLFRQNYKPLVVFCARLVSDRAMAEDIVQEVFVRFYQNMGEKPDIHSARPYLYTAVRNQALNNLKHLKVEGKYQKRQTETNDNYVEPEKEMEAIELEYAIYEAIEELPSKCQEVFRKSRFEGLTNPEIACVLGLSVRTVETHITHALTRIRKKIGHLFI